MSFTDQSRRSFIKKAVVAGIAVYAAPLFSHSHLAKAAGISDALAKQWRENNDTNFRLDGIAKVTGQKVYARDLRATDVDGWPSTQHHALLIRANRADKIFSGVNLSMLEKSNRPYKVLTAKEIVEDSVVLPPFYGDDMLLPVGQAPAFLGHPLVMLFFDSF